MHSRKDSRATPTTAVLVAGFVGIVAAPALAQLPPLPPSTPGEVQVLNIPAVEANSGNLQQQIQELQEMVRASLERQQALEARLREIEADPDTVPAQYPAVPGAVPYPGTPGGGYTTDGGINQPGSLGNAPNTGTGFGSAELTRGGTAGLSPTAPPEATTNMPPKAQSYTPKIKVGPGFQISDEDEEFVLQFHDLTQFDGRFYEQGGQQTTRSTFGIPRQWFIFNGRVGKPFEYYVALAEGFDNLNLLDAFLNVHFDDRFQIKLGRYKTPFTYEFYSLPVQGLPTPERSLFFNNFGLNRSVGAMAWGQLFDGTVDYAAGIFNSTRNNFLDNTDGKDFAGFVNIKPFRPFGSEVFKDFNVGGSVDTGHQLEAQRPNTLRVEVPTSGNNAVGVPFLSYRNGVLESGTRALWSLHASWYYQQLSLIAEWQSGYQNLAQAATPLDRSQIGVQSFYVWAGYFLTGETVSSRGMVKPIRNFDLRRGREGPGAIELVSRYNYMDIDDQVFTGGFADPNLWTDRLYTVDVGVNWYWNEYIKVFAGWQHDVFANPVLYRTQPFDEFQLTSDLFWFRFQVYF